MITGGASTQSRQPGKRTTPEGVVPRVIPAQGCYVFYGNQRIIDLPGGLHGPIFGYNPDFIEHAIRESAGFFSDTTSFVSGVEHEVTEILSRNILNADQIRFAKNGSDVCEAAVRIARAYTKRDPIAVCGYHGFGTSFAKGNEGLGVPEAMKGLVNWFDWGNLEQASLAAKDAACIIVEVPAVNDSWEEVHNFLSGLKELSRTNKCLFIMDEVVTGFRFEFGGASEVYRVYPDLYCWGKAMSNGHSVSALAGKGEYMELLNKGVFFSATFFDDPFGLEICRLVLERMLNPQVFEELHKRGVDLLSALRETLEKLEVKDVRIIGQPERFILEFDDKQVEARFNRFGLEHGVLFDRPIYANLAINSTNLIIVKSVFLSGILHAKNL